MITTLAYDAVEYPSSALPAAHPSHLNAVARMFGMEPAPVERCRMLEVGCGEGTHVIACALGLPEARFIGLDLSASAIDRGNRLIAELGLKNVTLHQADLTMWEPPAEPFEYIIAHGLYSWVPAAVRDALLSLFARALTRNGVGYVSYNVYPGCYIRRMLWEMIKFHTAGISDPAEKMRQAIEMAKFLYAGRKSLKETDFSLLRKELEATIEERDPRVVYHDDLAELNEPVYFHELMARAGGYGLRFVAEAEPSAMETARFATEVVQVLNDLAKRGAVWREQYLDFLNLRRFRMTLLSRDGRQARDRPDPAAMVHLAVSANVKGDPKPVDLAPKVPVTFSTEGASAEINLPLAKAALVVLTERWPERIAFEELLRLAAEKLGRDSTADERKAYAEVMTVAWMAGLVGLHGHRPRYNTRVSERPVASPLARIQIRSGLHATTLLHSTIRLDDEPTRRLLQVLDGTRDRRQIAAEVLAAFPADQRPDPAALMTGLERNLARLAREGLLVR
jgi:cyclopropane fatty-acyl-phospholipid synthase-like methyltransferase/methyltransferase-like protein